MLRQIINAYTFYSKFFVFRHFLPICIARYLVNILQIVMIDKVGTLSFIDKCRNDYLAGYPATDNGFHLFVLVTDGIAGMFGLFCIRDATANAIACARQIGAVKERERGPGCSCVAKRICADFASGDNVLSDTATITLFNAATSSTIETTSFA